MHRYLFLLPWLLMLVPNARANVAPTPAIISANMRAGTTYMDVIYRVNDPDDATVKVRVLAFVDGVRSFAKVLRPVTFVEGTASNIGDDISTNVNHVLTWNVSADWNVDLGQIKFEVLARDNRGLLAFDWVTIPAAGGRPALTISKESPSDTSVLDAYFWQYADGDSALTLTNGTLTGNVGSGVFKDAPLVNGASVQNFGTPYILKRMNLDPVGAGAEEVGYATKTARAIAANPNWYAINRPYTGFKVLYSVGRTTFPSRVTGIVAIAAGGNNSLALNGDGTVREGQPGSRRWTSAPVGLNNVTAIAVGTYHMLALKSDGTVVAWGIPGEGINRTIVPAGLTSVTAIAAGGNHSLTLKSDGTIVAWGDNSANQTSIPPGLTGVTAIAAGDAHSLALKGDGTVVGWGDNSANQTSIPPGLAGVTAIAAGERHSLALKSDGTVVAWGDNSGNQTSIPPGLTGVTAIAAGLFHSLALKSDGTVIAWGANDYDQIAIPAGLTGVTAIAAGSFHSLFLTKAP